MTIELDHCTELRVNDPETTMIMRANPRWPLTTPRLVSVVATGAIAIELEEFAQHQYMLFNPGLNGLFEDTPLEVTGDRALASMAEQRRTGGDVNYYLIDVPHPKRLEPYVAEVEDIIEALEMSFAEATVFKSLIRLCKLRLSLGKPGSSYRYEAEKIRYYANRIIAWVDRREEAARVALEADQVVQRGYAEQYRRDHLGVIGRWREDLWKRITR